MAVCGADICLVEDAQYLVEAVVNASVQEWNLHDDTLMGKTPDERVGTFRFHDIPIVVIDVMVDVDDGNVDVFHFVSEQIDRHHWQGMLVAAVLYDIGCTVVLC